MPNVRVKDNEPFVFNIQNHRGGMKYELSSIDFSPGYAEIETDAEKRLQALSQALIDRPSLK